MITAGITTFIILNILGLYTFSWWHLLWMIPLLVLRPILVAKRNVDNK
jgi:hypothetical protein